jgi:hypothetical protein
MRIPNQRIINNIRWNQHWTRRQSFKKKVKLIWMNLANNQTRNPKPFWRYLSIKKNNKTWWLLIKSIDWKNQHKTCKESLHLVKWMNSKHKSVSLQSKTYNKLRHSPQLLISVRCSSQQDLLATRHHKLNWAWDKVGFSTRSTFNL